ncbi:MAG: hypothetical protein PF569_08845 [Candidatus Woesearchaeota archaeon]|jgi:hypothetical protein|nr:hypothetical protein [Candidatus Woesearchaeota archaeon]
MLDKKAKYWSLRVMVGYYIIFQIINTLYFLIQKIDLNLYLNTFWYTIIKALIIGTIVYFFIIINSKIKNKLVSLDKK